MRTESLGKGKYRPVCYKDGKKYNGYIKTKGKKSYEGTEGLK